MPGEDLLPVDDGHSPHLLVGEEQGRHREEQNPGEGGRGDVAPTVRVVTDDRDDLADLLSAHPVADRSVPRPDERLDTHPARLPRRISGSRGGACGFGTSGSTS